MRQRGLFGEERELQIITHSAAECFQECRVKWDYRYNREIVPTEPQPALDFGTAIHAGLEFWFKYGTAAGAVEAGVSRGAELGMATADLCKVQVLLERYTEIYKEEPFEVVEVEKTFRTVLVNPRTMCQSRTYAYMGKVDALVKKADGFYILEHKTTSEIKDSYLEALELRQQTTLYAWAMEAEGYPVRGVIYDIIEKPGIKMAAGETEEEFEARRAALLAKSKTGKTTAQRREAETPDAFMVRLREKVTAASFRRVTLDMDIMRTREAMNNLWRTAKDMMHAEVYPNTGACASFGKVCPYLELCRKHGNTAECGEMYRKGKAHCELQERGR